MSYNVASGDGISLWEDPFYGIVLPELSLWDLHNLKNVSKQFYHRIRTYLESNSSIRLILTNYFGRDRQTSFLELLSLSEGLISGSMALSFFSRKVESGSILSIYVNTNKSYALHRWLAQVNYVQFKNPPTEGFNRPLVIERVTDFIGGPNGAKIQLIEVARSPMASVLKFQSTCAMNVVTAKYAISLYPKATFLDNVNMVCEINPQVGGGIEGKVGYAEGGWTAMLRAEHTNDSRLKMARIRVLGDSRCWSIRHTLGDCDDFGRHTWVAGIAKGGEEVEISFVNARMDEMTRWICVEGRLFVAMENLKIIWDDKRYRAWMEEMTSTREESTCWAGILGHRHTKRCE